MADPRSEDWQFTFKQWDSSWAQEGKSPEFCARAEFQDDIEERRLFEVYAHHVPEGLLDVLTQRIESLAPESKVATVGPGRHGGTTYELDFEGYTIELDEMPNPHSWG